ncbi:MAG: hypothetical protein HOI95_22345 [Chromatiales bacterium]|nr:hypothetical protein [Chromatiales bacterium]
MSSPNPTKTPQLPKLVCAEDRIDLVQAALAADESPLWSDSTVTIANVALLASLKTALVRARQEGALVRGLEAADRKLQDEANGMALAHQKSGQVRKPRISRTLFVSSDGSKRFYRDVESIYRHHCDRLLLIRLDTDEATLGQAVFGKGVARALLVVNKQCVASTLLALAGEGNALYAGPNTKADQEPKKDPAWPWGGATGGLKRTR